METLGGVEKPFKLPLAFLAYLESFYGCLLNRVQATTGHGIQGPFDL